MSNKAIKSALVYGLAFMKILIPTTMIATKKFIAYTVQQEYAWFNRTDGNKIVAILSGFCGDWLIHIAKKKFLIKNRSKKLIAFFKMLH